MIVCVCVHIFVFVCQSVCVCISVHASQRDKSQCTSNKMHYSVLPYSGVGRSCSVQQSVVDPKG